jgi:hypothetical protein
MYKKPDPFLATVPLTDGKAPLKLFFSSVKNKKFVPVVACGWAGVGNTQKYFHKLADGRISSHL